MQHRLVSSITSILLVNSIFCMGPDSLLQQVASYIVDHPELHEDLKIQAPRQANQDVGYLFCKRHVKESWISALCQSPLQESNVGKPLGVGDKIRGVSFMGTSTGAVSVTFKGIISWWETFPSAYCRASTYIGHEGVTGFSVTPDGKLTALAAGNTISLWMNETYQEIKLSGVKLDEQAYSVLCTPTRLVIGGVRGKIWIWNIENIATQKPSCIVTMRHDLLADRLASLNKIHALYVTRDGSTCISVLNKSIKVWNMVTGDLIKEFEVDCPALIAKVYFQECGWNPLAKKFTDVEIMSSFSNGSLVLTRVSDGRVANIKISDELMASCVPNADGKFLLTGSRQDIARLWERQEIDGVITYREIQSLLGQNVNTQIAFRSDSAAVLIGNNSGGLSLWGIDPHLTLDQAKKVLGPLPT